MAIIVFEKRVEEDERQPGLWQIVQRQEWYSIQFEGEEICRTDRTLEEARDILYSLATY